MKKFFINILIMFITIMLGLGGTCVQAMQDYQGSKAKTLRLSYFRYINGGYTNGYALNTLGNEGESHHPIYQIMNENNNTNYYCLNATAGESWLSGTIGTSATYNRSYDLNSSSDIEALKADSSLSTTYRNVVNSKYLNQIMWILDNMYVAGQTQGTSQKQELLAKAGIVFGNVDDEDAQGNVQQGYRYIAQPGYDYSSKVSTQGKKGYFYYDTSSNYHSVELPDDLVEVAGQTALWYYTNYLDNNSNNSTTYDVKSQWLPLLSSNGFENTNTDQWKALESETEDTNVSNVKADETKKEILKDRDSETTNAPSADQKTTGDKYTGYHGGDNNNGDNNKDVYKDGLNNDDYFPGKEDDDDFEVIVIKPEKVDLALTKFITAISDDTKIEDGEYLTSDGKIGSKVNPYTRATKVYTKELRDNKDCHDATYVMVKDPLTVPAKSYVLYNIRVYNEGETDVYAGEITDHLPEYLDYVDCEFNTNYGWQVGSDGKTIKSSYLGYNENDSKATNLLKAFDKKTDNGEGSGLYYRDIQVLCRVNEKAPSNTNIVNVAEITRYQKPTGEDISEDIDSIPNNVDKKKLNSTVVKFGYTIKITNEGDIAGYAKEITDYVPEGLQFYGEDNEGWTDEGNNVISTRLLENTLLQPGESAEVTVILRWINGSSSQT